VTPAPLQTGPRVPATVAILAHRGDSAHLPENTLPAFASALSPAVAADGLECDVRLDAAGQPRVFHDDDTDRLTGVPGAFAAHAPDRLDALRVGGHAIPHLHDLLALVLAALPALRHRPLTCNIELKPSAAAAPLIVALRPLLDPLAATAGLALVVSSFDPRVLAAARAAKVPWRLALLYETPLALRALRWLPDPDAFDLHPRHDLVDAAHLTEYARPGRAFRAWTVDAPEEARRLGALGVDALITNRPALLRAARDASFEASPRS